jgi:putative N-acetylmannosamine-6-phosphate epimerase
VSARRFADLFPRGLIVSCQAPPGDPLHGPSFMAAMAIAAERAGAVGIRANGPADVRAIREAVKLPIIGINKIDVERFEVRITPTFDAATTIADAGAHAIALDATGRPRPGGEDLGEIIRRVHGELGLPVMADISRRDEGLRAAELGADCVATTLSGHTRDSVKREGPDLDLVAELTAALDVPVVAEGRYWTPDDVTAALRRGAHAVVVGTAITRPHWIAERFVAGAKRGLASP